MKVLSSEIEMLNKEFEDIKIGDLVYVCFSIREGYEIALIEEIPSVYEDRSNIVFSSIYRSDASYKFPVHGTRSNLRWYSFSKIMKRFEKFVEMNPNVEIIEI